MVQNLLLRMEIGHASYKGWLQKQSLALLGFIKISG
jgi:hypothetical protein